MDAGQFGGRAACCQDDDRARTTSVRPDYALGRLTGAVVILDEAGTIVAHNSRWSDWSWNDSRGSRWVGVSYLDWCTRSDDPVARFLAGGIAGLLGESEPVCLSVDLDDPFALEPRCCRVRARTIPVRGSRHLLVAHELIGLEADVHELPDGCPRSPDVST